MNRNVFSWAICVLVVLQFLIPAQGQAGHDVAPPPPTGFKTEACTERPVPLLEDVTEKAGIHFRHVFSRDKKYIPESMSGGVVLIDLLDAGAPLPVVQKSLRHRSIGSTGVYLEADGASVDQ